MCEIVSAGLPPLPEKPFGPKTEMINWRGGSVEFCRRDGLGLNRTYPAKPPWYVVRYKGRFWSRDKWSYIWLDYAGPPKVFLTRKAAEKEAKAFRKQYGGGKQYEGPLKVEVIKISPLIEEPTNA